MANKFQIKRTTVSGRTPNTTNAANTMYIDTGELALNLADGKLFTSNGSGLIEYGTGTAVYDSTGTLITNTYMTYVALGALSTNAVPAADNLITSGQISYRFAAGFFTNMYVGDTSVNTQIVGGTTIINGGGNTSYSAININANNAYGGAGYAGMLTLRNTTAGATANTKYIRMSSNGQLEIVKSDYSATLLSLTDSGTLGVSGAVSPGAWTAGQVIKDVMLSNTEMTVLATTVATSTSDTDFLSYSYTPVSSSSYLIIHVHVGSYEAAKTGGSGQDSYFSRIKVDGNEITYAAQYTRDTYTFRTGALFPLTGRYTNSNTSAKAITVAVRRDSADDSITIVNSATALWMRITEIAR